MPLRKDLVVAVCEVKATPAAPSLDVRPPSLESMRRDRLTVQFFSDGFKQNRAVSDYPDVDLYNLVDRSGIDVEVNLACIGAELAQFASHAIVEPGGVDRIIAGQSVIIAIAN